MFPNATDTAVDLLQRTLVLDPDHRFPSSPLAIHLRAEYLWRMPWRIPM